YASMGRREDAIPVWQTAIATFAELEDNQREGETLLALGLALFKTRQREAGFAAYQAGLRLIENPTPMQKLTRTLLALQMRVLGVH
ncbi:MAG TPA: hypothetical protein PLD43_06355, partial [Anaerolineae bacterium]|nr:hypothetical protein [Anaerolineae bacterium]